MCTLMVGNHTSVVNPVHFPETLCNVIMRTNYKAGLPSTSPLESRAFVFSAGGKKRQINGMAREKKRCEGGHTEILWPLNGLFIF